MKVREDIGEEYELTQHTSTYFYLFSKRLMDILIGCIGLVIFSPLLFYISYKIKRQDPKGPVFFSQNRLGKNGEVFKIYKFRTMIMNAEEILYNNPKLYKEFKNNGYKFEEGKDPRITKIGHFLRRTSLDEIPQFINVVNGTMSIVGPRPVVEKEIEEYGKDRAAFLSVKPGITGLWQVSGRSAIGYPERCHIELDYVKRASLVLDTVIVFKTFISVIKKEGAY